MDKPMRPEESIVKKLFRSLVCGVLVFVLSFSVLPLGRTQDADILALQRSNGTPTNIVAEVSVFRLPLKEYLRFRNSEDGKVKGLEISTNLDNFLKLPDLKLVNTALIPIRFGGNSKSEAVVELVYKDEKRTSDRKYVPEGSDVRNIGMTFEVFAKPYREKFLSMKIDVEIVGFKPYQREKPISQFGIMQYFPCFHTQKFQTNIVAAMNDRICIGTTRSSTPCSKDMDVFVLQLRRRTE